MPAIKADSLRLVKKYLVTRVFWCFDPSVAAKRRQLSRLETLQKQYVKFHLDDFHGDIKATAEWCGVSRKGLREKLKRWGLYRPLRRA